MANNWYRSLLMQNFCHSLSLTTLPYTVLLQHYTYVFIHIQYENKNNPNNVVYPTTMSFPRSRITFVRSQRIPVCICARICHHTAQDPCYAQVSKTLLMMTDMFIENLYYTFPEQAVPMEENLPTNASCVNWNQYYSHCEQRGLNPFQGTISFDNIGMAWVAIFLVS